MKKNLQCFDPLTNASQKIYSHGHHALKWSPRRCCTSRHYVCWDSYGISPFSQPFGAIWGETKEDVKSWWKCKALQVAYKWELKEGERFVSALCSGCPEIRSKSDKAKLHHLKSCPMLSSAFDIIRLVTGMGTQRQNVAWLVGEWRIQGQHWDQIPMVADSQALCLTHPRARVGKRSAKSCANWCSLVELGWWSHYITDTVRGSSPLGIATPSLHISLQPVIRGITSLLSRRLVAVTYWQSTQPSNLHNPTSPINIRCLSQPLPQTFFILRWSFGRFAGAHSPQTTGSHEDPLPALCCSLPPLPGCSRWEAQQILLRMKGLVAVCAQEEKSKIWCCRDGAI